MHRTLHTIHAAPIRAVDNADEIAVEVSCSGGHGSQYQWVANCDTRDDTGRGQVRSIEVDTEELEAQANSGNARAVLLARLDNANRRVEQARATSAPNGEFHAARTSVTTQRCADVCPVT